MAGRLTVHYEREASRSKIVPLALDSTGLGKHRLLQTPKASLLISLW